MGLGSVEAQAQGWTITDSEGQDFIDCLGGYGMFALVERATRPDQRTIVGTLETLPALSVKHGVHPPALIMIGDTVSLQERIGGPALR